MRSADYDALRRRPSSSSSRWHWPLPRCRPSRTIADRIEWRPLAVKAPAALVSFSRTSKSRGSTAFWPYPTVETLRGLPQLEGLAATTQVGRAGLRVEGAAEAGAAR